MPVFACPAVARFRDFFRRFAAFPLAVLILTAALLAGCPPASTNWELSKFADKRVLVLENDIKVGCTGLLVEATVKGGDNQKFVLKFRDGQNRQVFVGEAAVCFSTGHGCKFTKTTLIVPEDESEEEWVVDLSGSHISQCVGKVSPNLVEHRIEIVE